MKTIPYRPLIKKTFIALFFLWVCTACAPSKIQTSLTPAKPSPQLPTSTSTPYSYEFPNPTKTPGPFYTQTNSPTLPTRTFEPTLIAALTLRARQTPVLNPAFSIPTAQAREYPHALIATLPVVEAADVSPEKIVILLFEKYFDFLKSNQASEQRQIIDGKIEFIAYYANGVIFICYGVKPPDGKIFFDTQAHELPDGRTEVCYYYRVTLEENIYKLVITYGG